MEFTDIDMLTGAPRPTSVVPSFADLKNSPKITVTAEMVVDRNQDNLSVMEGVVKTNSAIANITRLPPENNFVDRYEFPRRVLLEMTSKCNVLCRMCPRNDFHRPEIHMDADVYCRVLDEVNDHGAEGVWSYHLGESLMHPEFRKIIRYTERLNNIGKLWMSTNGHLMNPSNLEFVFDSRIDYLNYSLHAVTEKAFKTVSPWGDFNLVLKNYENLAKIKQGHRLQAPFVHLQMIDQETTTHETSDFIKTHYREVEIVSINMLEYVDLPKNAYGLKQRQRKKSGNCSRIRRNDCFICSNGAVTVCDRAYNCDQQNVGDLYIGNIHEQSLYEIWNGPLRKKLFDMETKGDLASIDLCSTCTDNDI